MRVRNRAVATMIAAIALLVAVAPVAAAVSVPSSPSFYGRATVVSPGFMSFGAAQLKSDMSDGGGIFWAGTYAYASGGTLADLGYLGADYNITAGDCGGGAPRFSIGLDTGSATGELHIYLGPPPSFTGCPAGWQSTGNILANADLRFDWQAFGGPFYGSYAGALAGLGAATVDYISFDVDGGWAVGGVQTVLVDNFRIDGVTYTYEPTPTSKDSCKKGGWQSVVRADGSSFKNQGDCIQYVNTGK